MNHRTDTDSKRHQIGRPARGRCHPNRELFSSRARPLRRTGQRRQFVVTHTKRWPPFMWARNCSCDSAYTRGAVPNKQLKMCQPFIQAVAPLRRMQSPNVAAPWSSSSAKQSGASTGSPRSPLCHYRQQGDGGGGGGGAQLGHQTAISYWPFKGSGPCG